MRESALTWESLLSKLKERFPNDLLDVGDRKGMLARLHVRPEAILPLAQFLRDEGTFKHCSLVTAVDWVEKVEILYHLWSDHLKGYLEISLDLSSVETHVTSVSTVWVGAAWHEREAWDLMNVRFDGHPDLRRILMPEGYRFHPLRKSFELREPEELEVKARHV